MPLIFKKILLSVVSLTILVGVCEVSSRFYERKEIRDFPPAPDNAEGFGDFKGLLRWVGDLGRVQGYIVPEGGVDYLPYTITGLKPSFPFHIKNVDYRTNAQGFRHEGEIVMPKPAGAFRIFLLGGSTVQGIFNHQWTISYYLDRALKANHPNVEVINAGVVGYRSQSEMALLTTKILDMDPDLVVVLDGRNDLYYSILPTWRNREGADYLAEKTILDNLVNYPSEVQISKYAAKVFLKRSSLATRIINLTHRSGASSTYPPDAKIKDEAVKTYLGNLAIMKAILESRGIRGILAFQPTLGYCKDDTSDYEKSVISYLVEVEKSNWLDEDRSKWKEVGERVDGIPDSSLVETHDLTCLFSDMKETAYIDSVHYVPKSSQVLGERFAQIVESQFLTRK